jgi:hypothetical protein
LFDLREDRILTHWYVATHKESLTREEVEKRASAQGR